MEFNRLKQLQINLHLAEFSVDRQNDVVVLARDQLGLAEDDIFVVKHGRGESVSGGQSVEDLLHSLEIVLSFAFFAVSPLIKNNALVVHDSLGVRESVVENLPRSYGVSIYDLLYFGLLLYEGDLEGIFF